MPEPGEGILLGGETNKDWLPTIVDYLSPLGYKLYAAENDVKTFIESTAKNSVTVEKITLPEDKVALREIFEKQNIKGVFNLAQARAKDVRDVNYIMRMCSFSPKEKRHRIYISCDEY